MSKNEPSGSHSLPAIAQATGMREAAAITRNMRPSAEPIVLRSSAAGRTNMSQNPQRHSRDAEAHHGEHEYDHGLKGEQRDCSQRVRRPIRQAPRHPLGDKLSDPLGDEPAKAVRDLVGLSSDHCSCLSAQNAMGNSSAVSIRLDATTLSPGPMIVSPLAI